jgi:RNA polymerase sigma-32 factor
LAEDPITLEELAEEFGVSRERVRQIEVRTYEKEAMRNRVAAIGIAAHPARAGVALNQVATSS